MNSKLNYLDFRLKSIFDTVSTTEDVFGKFIVYKFECNKNIKIDDIDTNIDFVFMVEKNNFKNDYFEFKYFTNPKKTSNSDISIGVNANVENIITQIESIIETKKMDSEYLNECKQIALKNVEILPINEEVMVKVEDHILSLIKNKAAIKNNISIVEGFKFGDVEHKAYIIENVLNYGETINVEIVLRNNEVDYFIYNENNKTIILL